MRDVKGHIKAGALAVLVDLCLGADEFFAMPFLNYHLRKKIVDDKTFQLQVKELVRIVWVVI